MKVVFMGTPDIAVEVLNGLICSKKHEVVEVVTQPDRPRGRSGKPAFSPVKEVAIKENIPVFQPEKIKSADSVEHLKSLDFDVIVVVAFGQILSKEILDMPRYGCVNVHASLLPRYRGAAPIQWAVINGEKVSGVTTMRMDIGIDTGDMIEKVEVPLDKEETGGSLFDRLAEEGAKLCVHTMSEIEAGRATYTKQDESEATHTSMIKKQFGKIDWTKSAVEIERLVRGLNPWPSAYTSLNGKTLKIWRASVEEADSGAKAGTIVSIAKDEIAVQTGKGILLLQEVQLEGKKRMPVDAFLRGYQLEKGALLQ